MCFLTREILEMLPYLLKTLVQSSDLSATLQPSTTPTLQPLNTPTHSKTPVINYKDESAELVWLLPHGAAPHIISSVS